MKHAFHRRACVGALSVGLGTAALAGASFGAPAAKAATTAPNIILIVADDLGYDQTSLYGRSGSIPTPDLDALGDSGIRATDGYVASPVCSPSRSAIMSGQEPARVGADSNFLTRYRPERMPTDTFVKNLPSQYTSEAIGKWDLAGAGSNGFDAAHLPAAMGFKGFYGFLGGEHPYCPPANGAANLQEYNPATGNYDPRTSTEYLTNQFTDKAVGYINSHAANSGTNPFFLYLAYNAPHTPLQSPTTCAGGTETDQNVFKDMVTTLDGGVGQVRQALASNGIANNTMIVFLSDNGQQTQYFVGSTRGGKYTLFEGGVRVPFAFSWPAVLPAGVTYDNSLSSLDLYDTILAASGSTAPSPPGSPGVNLIPYLTGQTSGVPNPDLDWRYVSDNTNPSNVEGTVMAARKAGDLKWIRSTTPPTATGPAQTTNYLFNLATNPSESDSGTMWPDPTVSDPLISDFNAWDALNPLTESFNNVRAAPDIRAGEPDGYLESGGTWTAVDPGTGNLAYQGTSAGFSGRSMLEASHYGDAKVNSTFHLVGAGQAGVIVRGSGAAESFSGYVALLAIPQDGSACAGPAPQPGGGSSRVVLTKVTNGTATQVACKDMALSTGTDYKVTVRAVGTGLTVSVGTTQELNWTDTSAAPYVGGRVGLKVSGATATQNAQAQFATLNGSACTGSCP